MLRMVVTLSLHQSVKRHGEVLPMSAKRLVIWLWLHTVIGLGSTLFQLLVLEEGQVRRPRPFVFLVAVLTVALPVHTLLVRLGRVENPGREPRAHQKSTRKPDGPGLELVRGGGFERTGGHLGQLELPVVTRLVLSGLGPDRRRSRMLPWLSPARPRRWVVPVVGSVG